MLAQIFKLFIIIASLISLSLNAEKTNDFLHNKKEYSKFLIWLLSKKQSTHNHKQKAAQISSEVE